MQINNENFAEYVRELHEFSETYRLPWGKPQDLELLLDKLKTSPAFANDFGSMLRSVVFREHFRTSPLELLNLVATAWGGQPGSNPPKRLPSILPELKSIVEEMLRRRPGEPPPLPKEESEADNVEAPTEVAAIAEPSETKQPDSQPDAELEPASASTAAATTALETIPQTIPAPPVPRAPRTPEIEPEAPQPRRRDHTHDSAPLHLALQISAAEHEHRSSPLLFQNSPYAAIPEDADDAPHPHRGPGAGDILAIGLAGMVIALLLTVASLPLYRVHVSVLVPAGNTPGQGAVSDEELLQSGRLTEQVETRLLIQPHPNPMFRQDALSRGLRDLNLGGRETLLYASLVAETAQRVKVRALPTPSLYEITCDSWSPEFAAIFCNDLVDALDRHGPDASQTGTLAAQKIDAAVSPGTQVYPHWYLQGILGFAGGSLLAALYGLLRRN